MRQILIVMIVFFFSVPTFSFDEQVALNFEVMTYKEMVKVDTKSLSKKERKIYKKLLKIKKKEAEKTLKFNANYGHMLVEEKIGYVEVVTIEGAMPTDMYIGAKQWLSSPNNLFQISGSIEKGMFSSMLNVELAESDFPPIVNGFRDKSRMVRDEEGKTLIAHMVIQDQNKGGMTNNIKTMFYEYDLRVDFKDGRYRIKISDMTYNNWNHESVKEWPIYPGKCSTRGTGEGLVHCPKQQKGIKKTMDKFYANILQSVGSLKATIAKSKEEEVDF